jgi:DtxR family transcriptional regulator, Mn-dependent transcriptional regulator
MKKQLTQTKEDYLRAIDHLEEEYQRNPKASEVVEYMQLAKSTVSERLQELAQQKLIKPRKYGDIEFTPKGKKLARQLTYKHRIIELFLHEILKMPKHALHEEAHKLEHAVSDEVLKRLTKLLKNPKTCPHGQELPKINKIMCV